MTEVHRNYKFKLQTFLGGMKPGITNLLTVSMLGNNGI